ncbi:hypothetical protein B0T16DRAFT_150579 [Cercophora newfieldiana]|uniref:Uncharacterized protein n=1 Tax=Cercophora newfieldiana TaxID=92897 RepID=A0AA39Y4P3_9PEZI|nr:hypothetical protein B0T16DRAFT_150579 [Cercophora newfieldiana]
MMESAPDDVGRYTVGWIAPMALELTAAIGMLEEHSTIHIPNDDTTYHVGRIGGHSVVMAVCPRIGTQPAAALLANMRRSFRNIKHVLVIGIAGAVPRYGPNLRDQIVLGDVVVGVPQWGRGGVVHYEFGAWENRSTLTVSEHTLHPSSALLSAVNDLQATHMIDGGSDIAQFLRDLRQRLNQRVRHEFEDPGNEHDHLFEDDYHHSDRSRLCEGFCDISWSKRREDRGNNAVRQIDSPVVHYGTIGSANTLVLSSAKRNELYESYGIICVEMESAGVMSDHQALVIRGICDYADSHKNKRWQKYAAATAAAYAKEVLLRVPAALGTGMGRENYAIAHISKAPSDGHNVYHPGQSDEKLQAMMRTLSFRRMDFRRQDVSLAHPQTCDWFLETHEFWQWRNREDLWTHNGVLWIKGKPGTGKSTLMRHILNYCQNTLRDHTIITHFFNARGDILEKTFLGMLRSLTWQLLDEEPATRKQFISAYDKKQRAHGDLDWRDSELSKLLTSQLLYTPSKPLILLIDALDECSDETVRHVVDFLEQLSIGAVTTHKQINICLSSRHYPHISMTIFREMVLEDAHEHGNDISKYIQAKLRTKNQEVIDTMLAKASGIFMWVVLVITMLNRAYDKGKTEALQRVLREVPGDLDNLYSAILRDNNENIAETTLVLQLVLFAESPLVPQQIYCALLAGVGLHPDQSLRMPWTQRNITADDIRRRIIDASRGLVETGHCDTVQFIHESVKDFLLRNQRLQRLDPSLTQDPIGLSFDRLKLCCLSYLLAVPCPLSENFNGIGRIGYISWFKREYPFMWYAVLNILTYANCAEERGISQVRFVRWLMRPEQDQFLERLFILYWLFEDSSLLFSNPGDGNLARNLLYIAVSSGNSCIARLLVQEGLDVNAYGGYYGTALQAAVACGHEEMFEMLLRNGAAIDAKGGRFGTALQAAASRGRKEMLELLLALEADVNAQGGIYGSALQAASHHGDLEIVQMLLAGGADADAQGGVFGSAINAALQGRRKGVLEILLTHGGDHSTREAWSQAAMQFLKEKE